jgi:hypothetical protein
MPRIRTIDPTAPEPPACRASAARRGCSSSCSGPLPTIPARLWLDHERLKDQLYPFDEDAPSLLPVWIGELESARCIELYRVDDVEYLRVRKWREVQSCIQRPTRSRLPAAPHEAHEPHEESPRMPMARASKANPHEEAFFEESAELPGTPGEFPPERVLDILEIALRKSLATDAQTATARYIELAGRKAGLWGGNGAPAGRKEPAAEPEMTPSSGAG